MKSFIVIGGGILGASTAYHLAKKGVQVTIIDRKDEGQATDAAAGIICPWLSQRRNKAWYALAKNGAAYYPDLVKQLKMDGETETGYRQVGAISIHTDEKKLEKMKERAEKRRLDAPEIGDIRLLSTSETLALFPSLSEGYRSVYVSGAARVDGRALRDALMRAARKYGAHFIEGSAQLIYENEKVIGASVGSKIFQADSIIVTAGAWAPELLFPLGITFSVEPQKAQIVHLQLEDKETNKWPVVMPPNNQYLLTFDKGRVVMGATHENEKGFDSRATAGGMNEIFSKALDTAPNLNEATYVETRVGFRPVTPNFLPVIGEVPEYPDLFVANGLGASGLTVGPFLGRELAKLALKEETIIDISLYNLTYAMG